MNQLVVNNRSVLTDFQSSDKDALVKHLNDPEIYDRTIGIPYPCTEGDAETALANLAKINTEQSHRLHWAVRTTDGALIGDCGFNGMTVGFSHKAEINYWLARPFWGQGIMTDVIRRLCRYGSDELSLVRIFAHVFLHNPASAKVLI
ncbi:MAG: GNAT family N-acetyltransferase, partial [Minisyncoccia bacterium]